LRPSDPLMATLQTTHEGSRNIIRSQRVHDHIAATVGISRRHTYKWIQRFVQAGLEGLDEKPGRGHRLRPPPPDLRDQPDVDIVF